MAASLVKMRSLLNIIKTPVSVFQTVQALNAFHSTPRLQFQVSAICCAEPLKKKRKIDPNVLRMREERRKKKIEKEIRRLQRLSRQLKPLEEYEVPPKLIQEQQVRKRQLQQLTEAELDDRISLKNEWTRYTYMLYLAQMKSVDRMMVSQKKALEQLRVESEELYQQAIQIDPVLIPFKAVGPVRTPPIESYNSPDGEYKDITRKWDLSGPTEN